jgi:hypothetical protein
VRRTMSAAPAASGIRGRHEQAMLVNLLDLQETHILSVPMVQGLQRPVAATAAPPPAGHLWRCDAARERSAPKQCQARGPGAAGACAHYAQAPRGTSHCERLAVP